MLDRCPGSDHLRGNITITEKPCPQCGQTIEIFSVDPYVVCDCGFVAYNDTQSCLQWCKYARECVGDEVYEQWMAVKGVGNKHDA